MDKELLIWLMISLLLFVLIMAIAIIGTRPEEMTEEQKNCEHEFVTTSEFIGGKARYRVVSKCVKCGYVVK